MHMYGGLRDERSLWGFFELTERLNNGNSISIQAKNRMGKRTIDLPGNVMAGTDRQSGDYNKA